MTDSKLKFKGGPLDPKEIKRVLFEREVKVVTLAQLAAEDLGREVTPWQMRAVIYRWPGLVYQDIREWLAQWLGVEVSRVGNEPARKDEPTEAAA